METPKPARRMRRYVAYAYPTESTPKWKRHQSSVPGWQFDAFVIGSFLVLVIGYFA